MNRLPYLGLAVLAAAILVLPAGPGEAASARVSITVTLGAGKSGTFRMTGGPVDAGRVVATRQVNGRRLITRQTLASAKGTLVLSSAQGCSRRTGTWKVVSGSGIYARATGGGYDHRPDRLQQAVQADERGSCRLAHRAPAAAGDAGHVPRLDDAGA